MLVKKKIRTKMLIKLTVDCMGNQKGRYMILPRSSAELMLKRGVCVDISDEKIDLTYFNEPHDRDTLKYKNKRTQFDYVAMYDNSTANVGIEGRNKNAPGIGSYMTILVPEEKTVEEKEIEEIVEATVVKKLGRPKKVDNVLNKSLHDRALENKGLK